MGIQILKPPGHFLMMRKNFPGEFVPNIVRRSRYRIQHQGHRPLKETVAEKISLIRKLLLIIPGDPCCIPGNCIPLTGYSNQNIKNPHSCELLKGRNGSGGFAGQGGEKSIEKNKAPGIPRLPFFAHAPFLLNNKKPLPCSSALHILIIF
jgi:hypothetical protein